MLAKAKARAVSQAGDHGGDLAVARHEPLPPQVSAPDGGSGPEPAAVTVVIVNYNAGVMLAECLASVLGQVRQVVLVDNASDPEIGRAHV